MYMGHTAYDSVNWYPIKDVNNGAIFVIPNDGFFYFIIYSQTLIGSQEYCITDWLMLESSIDP